MATSEPRNNDEDNSEECSKEWPLTYVRETKECICGWCGQVVISNLGSRVDLEMHFERCKNTKDNGLVMVPVFKDVRKIKQNVEELNAEMKKNEEKMKAEVIDEVKAEILNLKAQVGQDFEEKTMELKKELEIKCGESLEILFTKVNSLDEGMKEKMREMGAAQDMKLAEVSGRVSGATETMSTVIHSVLEAKGKDVTPVISDEIASLKNETEALWAQLRKSDGDFQTMKRRLEDERQEMESNKKLKPSPLDQLIIPMNCFNLSTHNYLFRPSYRWTFDGIYDDSASLKMFEVSGALFQWNGYPVRARAKLELKKDNYFYLSLCLKDESKGDIELNDFRPIPQVFYLIKDKNSRNPKHRGESRFYLLGSAFNYSLAFDQRFCYKNWLEDLADEDGDSAYSSDGLIEIEIYVEPSAMTRLVHSYDGTLEWNIENFKRRFELEKDLEEEGENFTSYQESPYFYTSPRGFRVQVRIMINGDGKGGGSKARILFLTGMFDAELPESFPHSTTVTLLNRKDPLKSIHKTIVRDIIDGKDYEFEICKVDEVEALVENDTLFCKVVIKPQ